MGIQLRKTGLCWVSCAQRLTLSTRVTLRKRPFCAAQQTEEALSAPLRHGLPSHGYYMIRQNMALFLIKGYAVHSFVISFEGNTRHKRGIILSAISCAVLSLDETQSVTLCSRRPY
jgi:hypothetical protein